MWQHTPCRTFLNPEARDMDWPLARSYLYLLARNRILVNRYQHSCPTLPQLAASWPVQAQQLCKWGDANAAMGAVLPQPDALDAEYQQPRSPDSASCYASKHDHTLCRLQRVQGADFLDCRNHRALLQQTFNDVQDWKLRWWGPAVCCVPCGRAAGSQTRIISIWSFRSCLCQVGWLYQDTATASRLVRPVSVC